MARLLSGVAAGFAATVPMTAAMIGMHRQLPRRQQYALPPRRITMRALEKVGVKHQVDEPARYGLTMLAHFAYGAGVGGLFGVLAPRDPARSIVAGIGYGLFVWTASYLGLLPSIGLHRSATREPAERNALMIAAHVVWGAALGVLAPILRGSR